MLMGEYHHSIDDKGRLTIPSKVRDELGTNFIVTRGLDGCLYIYSEAEWQNVIAKYKELPNNTKDYCDLNNQEIVIGKNLNDSMQLKVLIHEYAHSLAHKHLVGEYKDYNEHRNKYETEAEACLCYCQISRNGHQFLFSFLLICME